MRSEWQVLWGWALAYAPSMRSPIVVATVTATIVLVGCASSHTEPEPTESATSSGGSLDAAPSNENVPQTPSRTSVTDALRAIAPAASGCLAGHPGAEIAVRITFGPSGTVTSAAVDLPRPSQGPNDGARSNVVLDDDTRSCVEAALRTATVPPFQRESFFVSFPVHAP